MTRYLLKRILSALFTIWIATIAVTLLLHIVPGDPVQIMYAQSQSTTPEQLEQIRHNLGLDRPIYCKAFLDWTHNARRASKQLKACHQI